MDRPPRSIHYAPPRYTAGRSFVVQLRDALSGAPQGLVSGRVENVATGENAVFDTLQELEAFMRRSNSDHG